MKIARFSHEGGIAFGIVDGGDLVVLKGDPMFAGYDTTGERVALTDAKLLAPVIPRSKVIAMGNAFHAGADAKAAAEPREPTFILKPNTAVVGPDDPIVLPPQSDDVTAEGELTIVIGRIAKNVSVNDAPGVIFGYTIANDVTAADLMERDGQWARAKSFDSFCPVGPVIETDLDAATATIEGRINGVAFQGGSMDLAVHSIAEIVAFVSSAFTLLPGDLILTGAPDGPGAIVAGDSVAIGIPGIGVLSNPVRRA
jgi:2-keto-4-pentenoate hydratase/2-oxohepta-3-ene-1,7-dioic acid hydratase in catechol pathway